ncbi:MAG: hypothetical protein JWO80_3932 [Bryobacterales bacterium]|nr:hypothetical protein [Bryobacterales bacterium]
MDQLLLFAGKITSHRKIVDIPMFLAIVIRCGRHEIIAATCVFALRPPLPDLLWVIKKIYLHPGTESGMLAYQSYD